MKILILGAGGVGGYFGGRLAQAGADVTFLVRPKRASQIQADGLQIEANGETQRIPVQTVTADNVKPIYDLVLLTPKSFDLDSALEAIAPALHENTCILPFLNGYAHLAKLDARYGQARVLGGVAYISAALSPAGVIRKLGQPHALTFGPRTAAQTPMAQALLALCHAAAFDTFYSDDIAQALWDKWVFLATLAAGTTLYRGSIGEILNTAHGEMVLRALYAECLGVAQHAGFAVGLESQARHLKVILEQGSTFTASMLRDLLADQATEHEHILGELIQLAQSYQLATPYLHAAYGHLQVQAMQRAAGLANSRT